MHDQERSQTASAVLTHVRSHSLEMTVLHQSYLLYCHSSVAAQRTYMVRNGVSECAKFKPLGLL